MPSAAFGTWSPLPETRSQPLPARATRDPAATPRLIQARAAEIAGELTHSFEFSPTQRLAVHEAARCMAILEAIDRDLDERGLVDRRGKPRYLLNYRLARIISRGQPRPLPWRPAVPRTG